MAHARSYRQTTGGRSPVELDATLKESETEAEFNARVREAYEGIPGDCVLDCSDENIYVYHYTGNIGLVQRDLRAVLDEGQMRAVENAYKEERLEEAWLVRKELINFKKVCLHLFEEARSTEKDLRQTRLLYSSSSVRHLETLTLPYPNPLNPNNHRQMATYFFGDNGRAQREDGSVNHSERYTVTAQEMQRAKGEHNLTPEYSPVT